MNDEDFRDLVKKMRDAQDDYFANKGNKIKLGFSMKIERLVDEELERVPKESVKQISLF